MIRYEIVGSVGIITFDRPDARNAFTQQDVEALREALTAFECSDERVLVLTGADACFTAGADLKNLKMAWLHVSRAKPLCAMGPRRALKTSFRSSLTRRKANTSSTDWRYRSTMAG